VSGAQFLWLVLQHVLLRFAPARTMAWLKQRAPVLCTCCGAVMVTVKARIRPAFPVLVPVPTPIGAMH
jgi:hypothetical protein